MANKSKNKKNKAKKVNVFNQTVTEKQSKEFDEIPNKDSGNHITLKSSKATKSISTKEEINQKYLPYELRKLGILTSLVIVSLVIISFII
ncbi:MAG: hypothetical protein ACJ0G8_01160 [Dehalococcoidia bacterium]